MNDLMRILDSPVGVGELRMAIQLVSDSTKQVVTYADGDTGGNFLHHLARLPAEKQENVLPLFYLAVNKGVQVNAVNKQANTPLHEATISGSHWKAIQALQRLGADPYVTNTTGHTPKELLKDPSAITFYEKLHPTLWDAVEKSDSHLTESRLEAWCFPGVSRSVDGESQSLMDNAKDKGNDDIVAMLENYGETLDFVKNVLAGDVDGAQAALERAGLDDINLNTMDAGYQEDINSPVTPRPLVVAAVEDVRLPEMVEFLAKKGANFGQYYEGFFPPGPAFFISEYSHPKLPEDLSLAVLKKADLSLKNYRGRTILYEAQTRSPEFASKVLAKGVNIADRDLEGHTVVDNVLYHGMFHLLPAYYDHLVGLMTTDGVTNMEKLVLDGYEYIANTVDRFDAKKIAKEKGLSEVVAYLETAPQLFEKIRSIHEGARTGNSDTVKNLLDDKLALAKDKGGRNVLHLALLYGHNKMAEEIIAKYPDTINGKDNFFRTPLHYAAACKDPSMFHALVKAGAEDSIADCHNLNSLDYIAEMDKADMTSEEREVAEKGEVYQVRGMLEREKSKRYGILVYLKLQYDELKQHIEANNMKAAKKLVDNFEAALGDFLRYGVSKKPLLFTCVEHKAEDIALYLIQKGAEPKQEWVVGKQGDDNLAEAAYRADMKTLYGILVDKLNLNNRPWSQTSESSYGSSQVVMPMRSDKFKRRFETYPTNLDAKYLAHHMGECLQTALAHVAEKRPWDPIEFLAQWLHKHAQNLKEQEEADLRDFSVELERAESSKDVLRKKRQHKEAGRIRYEDAKMKQRQRELAAQEAKKKAEEEKRLKELEGLQKKQREGGDPYSQAPDLDTVTEELDPSEMDTQKYRLKNRSLPTEPPVEIADKVSDENSVPNEIET